VTLSIETLRPGDAERRATLDVEAFGSTEAFDPDEPTVEPDREVCAYLDGDLVGGVTTLPGGQYFGGANLPMGGVASVAVRGDHRGEGLARKMMAESIERMAARGEFISTLYPSTTSLYRSMGYEIAGDWTETILPLTAATVDRVDGITVRDIGIGDLSELRGIYDSIAADHDGWRDRADVVWDYNAHRRAKTQRAFNRVGYEGDRAVWALSYQYQDPNQRAPATRAYDIKLNDMVALNDTAAAHALGFLANGSTMAGAMITSSPRQAWAHLLAHPPDATPVRSWPWMTRLIDVPAALAARGYPPIDHAPLAIAVHDELRETNCGTWLLGLEQGRPSVTRTDDAPQVTLPQSLLATIYTGSTDPVHAFRQGRLSAETARDAAGLKAIFSPGNPTCPDFF
jgi:predicted acetyltransferase